MGPVAHGLLAIKVLHHMSELAKQVITYEQRKIASEKNINRIH
jgi:hypothetical protein